MAKSKDMVSPQEYPIEAVLEDLSPHVYDLPTEPQEAAPTDENLPDEKEFDITPEAVKEAIKTKSNIFSLDPDYIAGLYKKPYSITVKGKIFILYPPKYIAVLPEEAHAFADNKDHPLISL